MAADDYTINLHKQFNFPRKNTAQRRSTVRLHKVGYGFMQRTRYKSTGYNPLRQNF